MASQNYNPDLGVDKEEKHFPYKHLDPDPRVPARVPYLYWGRGGYINFVTVFGG